MGTDSTISSKGQVTIPLEVRQRLGLKAGDRVEFLVEQGRAVLQPVQSEENPFSEFVGALPAFQTIDQVNAWLRDLRGHDEYDDQL